MRLSELNLPSGEHSLEIAVRSGGHDVLGQSTTAGGLLIDMGSMRRIEVGATERKVRIEAGVLAGQLNNALQDHGLAVPLGCHPGVGVTGLTLGGARFCCVLRQTDQRVSSFLP